LAGRARPHRPYNSAAPLPYYLHRELRPVSTRGCETSRAFAYPREESRDLNQAYFDHQMSLIRADAAETSFLQNSHRREAASIAGCIADRQDTLGAGAAGGWMRHAEGLAA
jgi:hypothetical protein